MKKRQVTAFAPATVGNVGVGFDVLGLAVDAVGDEVTVSVTQEPASIVIKKITGPGGLSRELPMNPEKNTATVGLIQMARDLNLKFGFEVEIKKGIPLGSGMGGSAASAVAAVVAANKLLPKPLPKRDLLNFALAGEAVASGGRHADNVAPCLFGGLTLVSAGDPPEVHGISFPPALLCVLVHPHLQVETKTARAVLKKEVSLRDYVTQSALLAGFITGCERKNLKLIGESLKDIIIEPQRRHLIPGFDQVKQAALANGALGCSISGAGPSVFALAATGASARKIKGAMVKAFEAAGMGPVHAWISPINKKGAAVL